MLRASISLLALVAAATVVANTALAQEEGGDRKIAPFRPDARSAEIIAARNALVAKVTPVTDEMLRNPPPADWLQWRRTYDHHGHSPLDQINKGNVDRMQVAWSWSLPPGTSEIAPLVHDGVMYVYGNNDRIQALDAASGDLIWEYVRPTPSGPPLPGMAGTYRKNLTLYGDKLFFPTFDSVEVALDAKTGKVVWEHRFGDAKLPHRASSAALPVKGKLLQGVANCSRLQPGGCFVVALDANTGEEVWRVNTIVRPGEKGDETWNGAPLEDRQGAAVWTTGSYDPDLNLAYFGTGNTYNWQGLVRGDTRQDPKRAGLYINSTLAVDPDTGKMKWAYQHMGQDMWNIDWAFERPIVSLTDARGRPEKVVLATGKLAITDGMDAATGKWLFSKDQGLQNLVSAIDPKTGKKTYNPAALPDLSLQRPNLACGAQYKNWPASAYDEKTKLLYVVILTEGCAEQLPEQFTADKPYRGGEQQHGASRYQPGGDGNIGRLEAINVQTRQTVWTTRQRAGMASAALSTDGGLLFAGDSDRWFRAYDSATGKVLWNTRLSHTVNNFPITYSVGGKQYVAVASGPGLAGHQYNPEIAWPRDRGATMWVFALPEGAN